MNFNVIITFGDYTLYSHLTIKYIYNRACRLNNFIITFGD